MHPELDIQCVFFFISSASLAIFCSCASIFVLHLVEGTLDNSLVDAIYINGRRLSVKGDRTGREREICILYVVSCFYSWRTLFFKWKTSFCGKRYLAGHAYHFLNGLRRTSSSWRFLNQISTRKMGYRKRVFSMRSDAIASFLNLIYAIILCRYNELGRWLAARSSITFAGLRCRRFCDFRSFRQHPKIAKLLDEQKDQMNKLLQDNKEREERIVRPMQQQKKLTNMLKMQIARK